MLLHFQQKGIMELMIKAFIVAATTADGFIAKSADHGAYWSSTDDKKRFVELTKRAGVVVMGSTTYKTLPRPLKERVNIVYSRDKTFEGAEVTQDEPLAHLRGFSHLQHVYEGWCRRYSLSHRRASRLRPRHFPLQRRHELSPRINFSRKIRTW